MKSYFAVILAVANHAGRPAECHIKTNPTTQQIFVIEKFWVDFSAESRFASTLKWTRFNIDIFPFNVTGVPCSVQCLIWNDMRLGCAMTRFQGAPNVRKTHSRMFQAVKTMHSFRLELARANPKLFNLHVGRSLMTSSLQRSGTDTRVVRDRLAPQSLRFD